MTQSSSPAKSGPVWRCRQPRTNATFASSVARSRPRKTPTGSGRSRTVTTPTGLNSAGSDRATRNNIP